MEAQLELHVTYWLAIFFLILLYTRLNCAGHLSLSLDLLYAMENLRHSKVEALQIWQYYGT